MIMNRAFFSIAFIGCLVLCSCKQPPPPLPPPVPVNLFTVKAVAVTYYDRYTATTVALNQVNLLPEVQGYITGDFLGDHVTKGQNFMILTDVSTKITTIRLPQMLK